FVIARSSVRIRPPAQERVLVGGDFGSRPPLVLDPETPVCTPSALHGPGFCIRRSVTRPLTAALLEPALQCVPFGVIEGSGVAPGDLTQYGLCLRRAVVGGERSGGSRSRRGATSRSW